MLYEQALTTLFVLQSKGLKPGEELIFQIQDNQDFLTVYWACLLGRIIPVPCTVGNNDEQKAKLLGIYKIMNSPQMIMSRKGWLDLESYMQKTFLNEELEIISKKTIFLDEIIGNREKGQIYLPHPSDIAFVQFSSGSTGMPKGVILTHQNIMVNIYDSTTHLNTTSTDSSINWMPLTHDMGLIHIHLGSTCSGLQQYIMPPTLFLKRPTLWLEKAAEHRITQLYTTNFGIKLVMSAYTPEKISDWDLSKVRFILNGAEPISMALCNEFTSQLESHGLNSLSMLPVYGLAEATVGVACHIIGEPIKAVYVNRDCLNVGSKIKKTDGSDSDGVCFVEVGLSLANTMIRICDGYNNVLEEQTIGYIHIKGDNVTSGYYNNPEATQKMILEDQWIDTGDIGFIENGKLTITGREKDILIINGQNYYPHDIERVAEDVDGIELNKIVAAGAYNPNLQKDELVIFVLYRGSLEKFIPLSSKLRKYINKQIGLDVREVIPVRNIPKTTSGKLQRFQLRDQYLNGMFVEILVHLNALTKGYEESFLAKPQTPLEKKLHEIWIEVLEIDAVGVEEQFFEAGGNSLKAIQLVENLNNSFQINLDITSLLELTPTIRSMACYIEKKAPSLNLQQNIMHIEFELGV
jgi:acyl-CoA synthetase (AMP-forming)/AMP-acid ligase II/acyl carrier protein